MPQEKKMTKEMRESIKRRRTTRKQWYAALKKKDGQKQEEVEDLWMQYQARKAEVKGLRREEENRRDDEMLGKIKAGGGQSSQIFWK